MAMDLVRSNAKEVDGVKGRIAVVNLTKSQLDELGYGSLGTHAHASLVAVHLEDNRLKAVRALDKDDGDYEGTNIVQSRRLKRAAKVLNLI